NPLRQDFRQKKILCEFLGLDQSKVQTIVYFVGNCKFKTELPDHVITSGIGRFIKQFQKQILSTEEVNKVVKLLRKQLSESSLSLRDHLLSLRKRHSSITHCPRCGSSLVLRKAKEGANAGENFLGCEDYPKCRLTSLAQKPLYKYVLWFPGGIRITMQIQKEHFLYGSAKITKN